MAQGLRLEERFALGWRPEHSVCQPPTSNLYPPTAEDLASNLCLPDNPERLTELFYDDEVCPSVSGPGLFILAGSKGAFLAIADGIQP